jgi:hypothetical protein
MNGAAYERVFMLAVMSAKVSAIVPGVQYVHLRMHAVLDVWRDVGDDQGLGRLAGFDVEDWLTEYSACISSK